MDQLEGKPEKCCKLPAPSEQCVEILTQLEPSLAIQYLKEIRIAIVNYAENHIVQKKGLKQSIEKEIEYFVNELKSM